MARHRANINFTHARRGEVIDVDPDLWADEIRAGYLVPVDEHGEPSLEQPEPEVLVDGAAVSDLGDDDVG